MSPYPAPHLPGVCSYSVTMQAMGIQDYFDLVLTSKECGMEKPARQIFDIALTRVGVYDRSRAVHVGHHFGSDVEGAAGAGWRALYVKPPPLSDQPANPDKLPYQRCVAQLYHQSNKQARQ